jgi:hypothetical protein
MAESATSINTRRSRIDDALRSAHSCGLQRRVPGEPPGCGVRFCRLGIHADMDLMGVGCCPILFAWTLPEDTSV